MKFIFEFVRENIMKKTIWIITLLAAQGIISHSFAQSGTAVQADPPLTFQGNCVYPSKPAGVDGSKATEAEMLQFQKEMKEYLAKGNEFLACLDKEEKLVSKDATEEQKQEFKAKITQTYNAVVDEMNAISDEFNSALRAYKSQNP